jgi:hypothetical protein
VRSEFTSSLVGKADLPENTEYELRRAIASKIDRLLRRQWIARLPAAIGVALELREVRGGDVDAQTMADFEAMRRRPEIDLESMDTPRVE